MITLAQVLFELDTAILKRIVESFNVDPRSLRGQDKRQFAHSLAVELSNPRAVTRALNRCNARELRLLQLTLTGHSEGITPFERILQTAGSPSLAGVLHQVVDDLTNAGLAFSYGSGVYVPDPVRKQVPASLSDRYTLARALEMYDVTSLRRMRDNLGLAGDLSAKARIIEAIIPTLLTRGAQPPQTSGEYVRGMPATDREVLDYILRRGGAVGAVDLVQDLFERQIIDEFFRYDWQNRWKLGRERNAVDRLLAHGLIYVLSDGYGYNLMLVIPSDLRATLSGGRSDTEIWTAEPPLLQTLAPPEMTTPRTDILRDVVTLLAFVSSQEAARTSTGYMHKTALKAFARSLPGSMEEHAAFVYGLSREADLIEPAGERGAYGVTDIGYEWLEKSQEERMTVLYDAWLSATVWAEMYVEPLQRENEYRSLDDIREARTVVLQRVRVASAPGWYSLESVVASLIFYNPLVLAANVMGDDIVSPTELVLRLVGQCLCALGCADVGWVPAQSDAANAVKVSSQEQYVVPSSFRLTEAGRYRLGLEGAVRPQPLPQEDAFILQANAEIFVPPYLAAGILYRVLTFTESAQDNSAGNTVRITKESLRRALDRGQTVEEILTFLRDHSRTPVPQNVEYLIRETGGRHGSLRIGAAQLYIKAESPALLQEMVARKELKAHGIRSISDNVAILTSGDVNRLLRDLRKAGYLPVADNQSGPVISAHRPSAMAKPQPGGEKTDKLLKGPFNWDKLAKEDGRSWNEKEEARPLQLSISKPPDAVQALPLMRIVVTQAIKGKLKVELSYRASGEKTADLISFTPQIILGDLITGFSHTIGRQDTYDLTRAEWARLVK